jgi:hypothetical protein
MKFKSNTFDYYGVIFLHLFILALWLVLLIFVPIRNTDDWEGFVFSLLAMQLLLFTCSPIAHRIVIIDDTFITEKWLCFAFNRLEITKISDIGVCTHLSGNQVRQFAFLATEKLSDDEIIKFDNMGIFRRKSHKGKFIVIEHPQKGLDECMKTMADNKNLRYREIGA